MKTNINNTAIKSGILSAALGAAFAGAANAQPAPQVYLNGAPLRTQIAPIQQKGRTLVPMRDIFESLGATVNYNSLNRSIAAQKGTTIVRLALGTRNATINNVPIKLDVPAQTYYGRTVVPLRFVSEALGANVSYNSGTRIVSINNGGAAMTGGTQVAGMRQISIPAQSVIPVTLDQDLSSATAIRGQRFTATVISERLGDSEFPRGTKIEGVVTESTRKSGNNPGTLDLRFRNAVLPNGTRVPLGGQLIALDNDSVVNANGRVVATEKVGKGNALKVIGIGAGAGFVIGKLLKKDGALPAILGAAGGFLYGRLKNKDDVADARVAAGTKLGVLLNKSVAYSDTSGYYDQRAGFVRM